MLEKLLPIVQTATGPIVGALIGAIASWKVAFKKRHSELLENQRELKEGHEVLNRGEERLKQEHVQILNNQEKMQERIQRNHEKISGGITAINEKIIREQEAAKFRYESLSKEGQAISDCIKGLSDFEIRYEQLNVMVKQLVRENNILKREKMDLQMELDREKLKSKEKRHDRQFNREREFER